MILAHHPLVILYIALVVTVSLVIQFVGLEWLR